MRMRNLVFTMSLLLPTLLMGKEKDLILLIFFSRSKIPGPLTTAITQASDTARSNRSIRQTSKT